MNYIVKFISFLLATTTLNTYAQNDSLSYIKCKNQLLIRYFNGYRKSVYTFPTSPLQKNQPFISPATTFDHGIGIHTDYGGWHLWLPTQNHLTTSPANKPHRRFDAQSNFYTHRLSIDLHMQEYENMFYGSSQDQKNWFPSIRLRNYGFNVLKTLNSNFSISSGFSQTERMLRSGGSGVVLIGASYLYFNSEEAPSNEKLFSQQDYLGIWGGGGYVYTFVLKNWYTSISGIIAPGIYQNSIHNETGFVLHPNIRYSIGYNSKTWFFGTKWTYDSTIYFGDKERQINLSNLKIFVGYRFGVNWGKFIPIKS